MCYTYPRLTSDVNICLPISSYRVRRGCWPRVYDTSANNAWQISGLPCCTRQIMHEQDQDSVQITHNEKYRIFKNVWSHY